MAWNHKQSVKELVKHMMFVTRTDAILHRHRKRKGFGTDYLAAGDAQSVFTRIYDDGAWVHEEDQTSKSGLGSEASAAEALLQTLRTCVADLEIETLVDVGCGDWNWMRHADLPCRYAGFDIVPSVIAANQVHANDRTSFAVLDAITEELPKCDLVLCREVLFHLSFADARSVLANIRRNARWALLTTDDHIWFNANIRTGDFRNINLRRRPFGLPAPRKSFADGAVAAGRQLDLWATEDW